MKYDSKQHPIDTRHVAVTPRGLELGGVVHLEVDAHFTSDAVLQQVRRDRAAMLRRIRDGLRCVVCSAAYGGAGAFCVSLSYDARLRLGMDVVITCGSAYCVDRAERGDL